MKYYIVYSQNILELDLTNGGISSFGPTPHMESIQTVRTRVTKNFRCLMSLKCARRLLTEISILKLPIWGLGSQRKPSKNKLVNLKRLKIKNYESKN